MTRRTTGRYERTTVGGEEVAAFIPFPLPPTNPPLEISAGLTARLHAAEDALLRLEVTGQIIAADDALVHAFVRKEAVLSSRLEGSQATLVELWTFEARANDGATAIAPTPDLEELCNYVDALTYCREQLAAPGGLPLSMRLLNEAHERLMNSARGAEKSPGEVRRSQNWINGTRPGNARYVPPPAHALGELLSAFEKYLHAGDRALHPLARAGLCYVQFETIHPYLDGNGRIGRLLLTLLFEHWKLLTKPLHYSSLFLERHRYEYDRRLHSVESDGDWEGWLDFFLDGVATIADEAVQSVRDLFALVAENRARLLADESVSVDALRLFERLPRHPIVTVASAMTLLEGKNLQASRAIEWLVQAGVLVESPGKSRVPSYAYRAYVDQLVAGTELAPRG